LKTCCRKYIGVANNYNKLHSVNFHLLPFHLPIVLVGPSSQTEKSRDVEGAQVLGIHLALGEEGKIYMLQLIHIVNIGIMEYNYISYIVI